MKKTSTSTGDLSCLAGRYKDFFITKASSMFGAYELGGIDPTGLGDRERIFSTALVRSIIRNSPPDMVLTQYYIHQKESNVSIKERDSKRSNIVSKRREIFLNSQRDLYSSKVYFMPELPFARDLTSWKNFEFLQNLISTPLSKDARKYIKIRFSERASYLAYADDVKNTELMLQEEIQNHLSRLDLTSFNNHQLSSSTTWSLMKALNNFDFDYLSLPSNPSSSSLDSRIFEANINPVNIGGVNFLKFSGLKTVYVRIATVKGFSDEYIKDGLLTTGANPPLSNLGNYVFMSRYRGFEKKHQEKHFKTMTDDVARNQVSVADMMFGKEKTELERLSSMSEHDKSILSEVQQSQSLSDYHGEFESYIAVFSENPSEVNETAKKIRASLNQAGVDLIWESAGLQSAFECFLPGSQFKSKRSMVLNASKVAALSLNYKSNIGIPHWDKVTAAGTTKEEAFYIFESNDGTPFYYTPYIGGKSMTIGVGPIRSGKTFLKNTLATHFMKFGGLYTAIDIDPGTEAVANFFQDDGSIFRIDDEIKQGFNPFFIANGENDRAFRAHFVRQLEQMIQSNSSEELQKFTRDEQIQIDEALFSTLKLPKEMQSFSTFIDHCNDDVSYKLSRFYGDGNYARIYDNKTDAIGSLSRRFSVYNIMGVKGDPIALPITMNEIVYRVLRSFENPNIRDSLKELDIDECHNFLKIKGMPEFLVNGVRTWGKWNGSVSLWTQNPRELGKIEDWAAVRSAASTFWFMADAEMSRDVYREVFELSEGYLDAIENLKPKQQAFIYQPEIGVAKVINLHEGPEQRVINTSVAGEATTLERNLKLYGSDIDKAIQQTIQDLNFN
ncbi:MAG: hypothetical protein HRU24_13165 [Gammaproteobacteria bacterium]|nr:hypothetical protein [Gammaproteobacteria bacterium]